MYELVSVCLWFVDSRFFWWDSVEKLLLLQAISVSDSIVVNTVQYKQLRRLSNEHTFIR